MQTRSSEGQMPHMTRPVCSHSKETASLLAEIFEGKDNKALSRRAIVFEETVLAQRMANRQELFSLQQENRELKADRALEVSRYADARSRLGSARRVQKDLIESNFRSDMAAMDAAAVSELAEIRATNAVPMMVRMAVLQLKRLGN